MPVKHESTLYIDILAQWKLDEELSKLELRLHMNPYIFKRKDEPIAIINLTEDGSIVNYKLNSKMKNWHHCTQKVVLIG